MLQLCWKSCFTSSLLTVALRNHYMLGKCLGKMYNTPEQTDVTVQDVINCYVRAIETVPERRDRQDPIFEPHYKLASVVHKFVQRRKLEV
jgi:hypothetical protein